MIFVVHQNHMLYGQVFEEALERFVQSIDEDALMSLRQGIYKE